MAEDKKISAIDLKTTDMVYYGGSLSIVIKSREGRWTLTDLRDGSVAVLFVDMMLRRVTDYKAAYNEIWPSRSDCYRGHIDKNWYPMYV